MGGAQGDTKKNDGTQDREDGWASLEDERRSDESSLMLLIDEH